MGAMRALWGPLSSMDNCWQFRGYRYLFLAFSLVTKILPQMKKKESVFGQEHLLTVLN